MGSSWAFRVYVVVMTLVGLGVVVWAAAHLTRIPPALTVLLFVAAYVVAELFQMVVPSGAAVSFGAAVVLGCLTLAGPEAAILLQAAGTAAMGVISRTRPERFCVNFAHFVLSAAWGGLVFTLAGGVTGEPLARFALPLGAAILAVWLGQLGLTSLAMSLYKRRSVFQCARDILGLPLILSLAAALGSLPLIGAALAWGEAAALIGAAGLFALLSLVLRRTARRSQETALDHLLAGARRGETGSDRSERLVRLVSVLAHTAGLPAGERDALEWAALLHDIGSGEEEPTPADPRGHPMRAAALIGRIGSFLWVARILEAHHELYNGWGYPAGLKGEAIPFPAALLGLAEDYLDLTNPRDEGARPMTAAEALAGLRSRSGEKYSPRAVSALERALELGPLSEAPEPSPPSLVGDAAARLRRAATYPGLPGAVSSRERGFAAWKGGWGGLGSVAGRLFPLWFAFHVHRHAADWYRSLYELGRVFNSVLDVESLAGHTVEAVYRLTLQPCELRLLGDDGLTLECAATRGLPRTGSPRPKSTIRLGLCGVAFAEGRAVVSVDLRTDPRADVADRAPVEEAGIRSAVVVPLMAAGAPLGAVVVYSSGTRTFSPPEVEVLAAITNIASLALQNAALYRKAGERLAQLVEAQRYLQTVLDTAPVGIVAFDREGSMSMANRVAARHLGAAGLAVEGEAAAGSGVGGETAAGFVVDGRAGLGGPSYDEVRDRLGLGPAEARRPGRDVPGYPPSADSQTASVDLPSGRLSYQVWSSLLEGGAGSRAGVLLVIDDVTETRRLEEEVRRAERLAAVGEMAARAAHEIRNPLSSLRGFTQLLSLYCPVRDEWPECAAFVDRVGSEIERLNEIVQSMLVMSRPGTVGLEECDVTAPVFEVLAMVAGRAAQLGVMLKGPVTTAGVVGRCDPRQIKQVVLNLLQNALDAVSGPGGPPHGRRRVEVTVSQERRSGRSFCLIEVRDNGPGIGPAELSRIFAPFFTTKEDGTGLGLPVCRGIIEAHGGQIICRPSGGPGAVFEVLLPAP